MKTPNKATKLKWMKEAVGVMGRVQGKSFFTCHLFGSTFSEARLWYQSVLEQFLPEGEADPYADMIKMFHDAAGQSMELPHNIENRTMWMFMLKTLVEDGQL